MTDDDRRIDLLTTDQRSRRDILKTSGAALTALTGITTTATAQDSGLDAHTGEIEVIDKNSVEAEGQVTGMDGREVKVGCEHKYEDEDEWQSGFYGTVAAKFSVTFILTIEGLTPGKRCRCRIIACPKDEPDKLCKGETKEFTIESKNEKKHNHGKHGKKGKHGKCPCRTRHPKKKHVTFCGEKYEKHRYRLEVTGDVWASSQSCKPSVVPHHKVSTNNSYVDAPYVYGGTTSVSHSYLFTGSIEAFEYGGTAYLNGRKW